MMNTPKTPTTSSLRKLSKFYSPPERKIKRSKLPPPLDLQPLSPPPTLKKLKKNNKNLVISPNEVDLDLSYIDKSSPLYSKQNHIINDNCAICSEQITTKLRNEKILKLNCSHICHYDCYSLYKEEKDSFSCLNCGETDLKLIDQDEEISLLFAPPTITPIDEEAFDFLSEIQLSAFKPKFNEIPITPVNQMIDNSNPQGFKNSPTSTSSTTTTATTSSINSPRTIDLARPTVNLISYKEKNIISNVLNIFTTELQSSIAEVDQMKETPIKAKIHDNIINLLKLSISEIQGIDFDSLPSLKLFDSFEISIDGTNWELINCFIFDDIYLILVNELFNSIIGSIMLKEHFSSFTKVDDSQLIIYLKSSSLPELQLRSTNGILISKYESYFNNFNNETNIIPLIQMSTNLWSLVESNVEIPQEVKKFNELSSKGLNLPLNLLKSMIPKPSTKPINLILVIPLFNLSSLSNDDYLATIQSIINKTISQLNKSDKLGLIIQGRDGERVHNINKSSYLGMISVEWSGWNELIDELEIFKPDGEGIDGNLVIKSMLQSLTKLNSMIIEEEESVKELVFINGLKGSDTKFNESELLRYVTKLNKSKIIFNQIDIIEEQDDFNESLIDMFINFKVETEEKVEIYKNFKYSKYQSITKLNDNFDIIFNKLKRIIISNFSISLKIPLCYKLRSIESIKFKDSPPIHEIIININGLHDGFFKNLHFELELIGTELLEIPITYKYNKNEFTNTQKLQCGMKKDTILAKREIELMIIENLKIDTPIEEIQTEINEKINGCSSKHLNFFKLSEFNQYYKNFVHYIDELNNRLSLDDKSLLLIDLKLESITNPSV